MALAEPALRQYGFRKLQNVRFRGGNLVGTIIGQAIGIGYGVVRNYDVTWPWDTSLSKGERRPFSGNLRDETSSNVSTYQHHQALRPSVKTKYYRRNRAKSKRRRGCCCTCC